MISKLSSIVPTRRVRAALAAVVVALVLVPTLARARQQVERRDATRLSIKHSWLGVMRPSNATAASIAPVHVAVLRPPVIEIDAPRSVAFVHLLWNTVPREMCGHASDPLRGPPALF